MKRKIERFFRSQIWRGFVLNSYVVIFMTAFVLFVHPHMDAVTYSSFAAFFVVVIFVDLWVRFVYSFRHREWIYTSPFSEGCARALRNRWVQIKLAEQRAGREVPADHLILWDDWDDERNKAIDRELADAVVGEFERWRSENE